MCCRWQNLYFVGGKNRRMVRTEILAKRSGALVDSRLIGGKKAFAKRVVGRVFLDFVPLARIRVDIPEELSIEWKFSLMASLGLPRADVEKELRAAGDNEAGVQWG